MHVDAAYGCGLLVSEAHRQRLNGIEKADSVTVDYHKSFFQTVSCGAFFVRDKQHLSHVTHHADYLNPLSAQQEGTPNLVNKSIQTTRRFDALKMWLTLRIMGPAKLGEAFDSLITLTQATHQLLKAHPVIEVLHAPELTTQIFRFVPRPGMNPPRW
jgi:L-2,4-diaminobutyrate decarboxylase